MTALPVSHTLPAWVGPFFDSAYVQYNLTWSAAKRAHAAHHLLHVLGIRPPENTPENAGEKNPPTILDQCCGVGDLSLGLGGCGVSCIGVEQSADYVAQARVRAQDAALSHLLSFECADAGAYIPPMLMDGAVSWHTSIGYAGEQGAWLMLRQLRNSVKEGARYVLECRHLEHYRTMPLVSDEHVDTDHGLVHLQRQGRWNGDVLTQTWTARQNGVVVWSHEDAACFHPSTATLVDWIVGLGDRVVAIQGALDKPTLMKTDERLIVVGERCGIA